MSNNKAKFLLRLCAPKHMSGLKTIVQIGPAVKGYRARRIYSRLFNYPKQHTANLPQNNNWVGA